MRITVAALALAACVTGTPPATQTVTSVTDGDTLTVGTVRVRLADVDAPELDQAGGRESRASLAALCLGKPASVETAGTDRYGRTLARVACAGTDASRAQVERGMAWVFTRYAPAWSPLYAVEREARAARRGLWADPAPIAPWTWRARR